MAYPEWTENMTNLVKTSLNREKWLPRWFIAATRYDSIKENAYTPAKNLDYEGWVTQIQARMIYLSAADLIEFEEKESVNQDLKQKNAGYSVIEPIAFIQSKPIVTDKSKIAYSFCGDYVSQFGLTDKSKNIVRIKKYSSVNEGVNELTLRDYFHMLEMFAGSLKNNSILMSKLESLQKDFEMAEYNDEYSEDVDYLIENKFKIIETRFSEILPDITKVCLCVDTLIPDVFINKQFKTIISDYRDASGRHPVSIKYNSKRIDFFNSRVLQYLDLKYWSDVNGIALTEGDYANAIFPESDKVAADIEKVTKVNAKQFLTFAMVKYFKAMDLE